jgi:formate hydrogenlyase subunit 6/NADH:ubiquinone oxidoreductase subunit I
MSMTISEACTGCTACVKVCPVNAISGVRKGRHVIDASRCIECGACGRVCPANAVYDDKNQMVERRMPRTTWAKPVFDLTHCISCEACGQKCPTQCIGFTKGDPGGLNVWPSLVEPAKCVSCGYCAFYCPMDCITIVTPTAKGEGDTV